jgi:uncharacterized protein YjdB
MLRMSKALFTGTVVLALLAACGESAVTGTNSVATVELSAPATTVRAGGTLSLSVRLKDLSGNPLDNVAVFWSTSDPKIAIVSNSGVVSATAAGVVTIAASALGKSATTAITVTDRDVATVQITPATVSVRIASSVPLTARALDSEGNTLQRTLSWTTSDASVAIVSAAGVVSGVAPGAATITATSDGRSGTAAVTVSVNPVATVAVSPARDTIGVGAETSLTATLRDAAGTVVTGRSLAWSASDVQVATVSSTGVVTALAPGIVTITAASEGRIGTSSIVVLARLASTVTLTPGNPTVLIGSTVQLLAQITDGSGNILNGRPITFVSDNGAVATVDATGMIRGISVGTAKVTATSEGKIGTATITVAPLPVATVNVTPPTATIFIGATAQLGAHGSNRNMDCWCAQRRDGFCDWSRHGNFAGHGAHRRRHRRRLRHGDGHGSRASGRNGDHHANDARRAGGWQHATHRCIARRHRRCTYGTPRYVVLSRREHRVRVEFGTGYRYQSRNDEDFGHLGGSHWYDRHHCSLAACCEPRPPQFWR